MTPTRKCRKFWVENARPRRALPCLDQDSIFRILPRASLAQKIYLNPRSSNAAATFGNAPARAVENRVSATGQPREFCTTSATWRPVVHTTFTSSTRNINAPSARSSLTQTPPTTLCPKPTIPIALFPLPFASWSRTACRINRPVGTCGATIEFLSLTRPSKTGWRPGGKKAASQVDGAYLDWALADFSGYVAIDELYDGPFCVLSIVDNRTFKRLIYQVLDHDPNHKDITDTEQQKRASCERLERARRFAFSSMVSLAKPFSSCFLRCLVHVSLAPPFASRFLACLIPARKYRLASRFR